MPKLPEFPQNWLVITHKDPPYTTVYDEEDTFFESSGDNGDTQEWRERILSWHRDHKPVMLTEFYWNTNGGKDHNCPRFSRQLFDIYETKNGWFMEGIEEEIPIQFCPFCGKSAEQMSNEKVVKDARA